MPVRNILRPAGVDIGIPLITNIEFAQRSAEAILYDVEDCVLRRMPSTQARVSISGFAQTNSSPE